MSEKVPILHFMKEIIFYNLDMAMVQQKDRTTEIQLRGYARFCQNYSKLYVTSYFHLFDTLLIFKMIYITQKINELLRFSLKCSILQYKLLSIFDFENILFFKTVNTYTILAEVLHT